MTRSKQKGTAAESAVVRALVHLGWPYAERRALSGNVDKGDISGVPGVCFEVKDAKIWLGAAWMRETRAERRNAGADYGILVIKAPRIGYLNASKWLSVMDDDEAYSLYNQANLRQLWPDRIPQAAFNVGPVGLQRGYEELIAEEFRHSNTPVMVRVKARKESDGTQPPPYNLMRFDARCRLLLDAGYGGHTMKDAATSSILKESAGDN